MNTPTTIVAPATPHGVGGIAVVRISGPASYKIGQHISGLALDVRHATYININDLSGFCIDRGIAVFYKNPGSYTGEDVVEISCHGNPVIVQRIVDICCELGATLAEPGEFTRRAFINGKLDLVQAESVGALIQSQSAESASLNLRLLEGDLSKMFAEIKQVLLQSLSSVEFELDISEDILQPNLQKDLFQNLSLLVGRLSTLLDSYQRGKLLTQGAKVVIVGSPNVGKSTLLNRLVGFDRAITSAEPGTTRDPVDVNLIIGGVSVSLIDTAGLRSATGEIEKEGISRTLQYAKSADCIIEMYEARETNNKVPSFTLPGSVPRIQVFNKIDLLGSHKIIALRKTHTISCFISALSGEGLEELESKIKETLGLNRALSSEVALTTARQRGSAKNALASINNTLGLLSQSNLELELISFELHEALQSLDRILGKTTPDDILNNIFGSFCVGK